METIDKLIFNQLARKEGVNLPGIGSLGVIFRPAYRRRRKIEPPVNQAHFTRRKNLVWPSLPTLIEQQLNVDPEAAQNQYNTWLSHARREDGTMVIGGAGEIRHRVFTPSPKLKSLIDRGLSEAPIRIRRRCNPLKIILLFLAIASVAFLAVFAYLHRDALSTRPDRHAIAAADTTERIPQEPEQPADTTQTTDNPTIEPDSPLYHLVAGVFSTEENADRFIAESQQKGGTFPYRKVTMPNGRIVVSIFASPERSETDRRRVEMRSTSPDLWIYFAK